jgi:PAS domain S-box-containing protein
MVAVLVLDTDGRCNYLNAVAEVLAGFDSSEAFGRPVAEIIRPADGVSLDDTPLGQAVRQRTEGSGEIGLLDRRGQPLPVAFRAVPLTRTNGDVHGTVIELIDLTGETGSGRALREREERLRFATAATGIGIWDVDARTGHRRWSGEFLDILGLPPGTTPDSDLFAMLIHPDDRDRVDAEYRRAYSDPEAGDYHAEFRIRRADTNEERWVVATGLVTFDGDGNAVRGIGTLRDVHERRAIETALKESEQRLRIALAAGRMGIWRYDFATGRQEWNHQQYALFGLAPSVEPTRELFLSLVHPEDLQAVSFDLNALPPAGTYLDSEFRIVRPDGTIRWITAHALARYDAAGAPTEMIGVNWDVTARRGAEEQRELLLHELTHRVKNILALVQAVVSQTLRTTRDPEDAYERILARLSSLARTHDLLVASRWVGAPLEALLATALQPFAGDDEGRLHLAGPPVEIGPRAVLTIGMVAHELATNAAKYGPLSRPEGRLDLKWEIAHKGGEPWVTIDWREQGGPPVVAPTKKGFGSRLIERSVEGNLGGKIEIDYAEAGFRCQLSFPLRPAADKSSDDAERTAAE